ncbi:hypothetical protein V6N12_009815 [Hibiscus sabdariffa]|uniref:Uncharacterized protein n=1 Tax=Hibiscus sabdariffa TaxID=183260 RepID=A0ABR2EBU0_9ROSI
MGLPARSISISTKSLQKDVKLDTKLDNINIPLEVEPNQSDSTCSISAIPPSISISVSGTVCWIRVIMSEFENDRTWIYGGSPNNQMRVDSRSWSNEAQEDFNEENPYGSNLRIPESQAEHLSPRANSLHEGVMASVTWNKIQPILNLCHKSNSTLSPLVALAYPQMESLWRYLSTRPRKYQKIHPPIVCLSSQSHNHIVNSSISHTLEIHSPCPSNPTPNTNLGDEAPLIEAQMSVEVCNSMGLYFDSNENEVVKRFMKVNREIENPN